MLVGAFLGGLVLVHALAAGAAAARAATRADRRQFLAAAFVGAAAVGAWALQRPLQRALGLRGRRPAVHRLLRRGVVHGQRLPGDVVGRGRSAAARAASAYRLARGRRGRAPVVALRGRLDRGDEIVATLDCTGGFASTQRWRGVRIGRLLDDAGGSRRRARTSASCRSRATAGASRSPTPATSLLATHVGGEPLTHGHGAPCRLVVPGHRGFQWVKWVTRVEVTADADLGAAASTVWSSLTAEGRGAR